LAADATPALLYLPGLPQAGERFDLEPAEAHYVARVCRARAGERVEATDGRGARAALRLVEVHDRVTAEVESVVHEAAARRSWVLCGAPEGERADWLVEKLAELGVERFVPVDCARGRWKGGAGRRSRWQRLAVAALRQSRRLHLLAVEEPVSLGEALSALPAGGSRWLADVRGTAVGSTPGGSGDLAIGLVGPSGGLDDGEREAAAAAGFRPVRLADARLRTETAALAWAACWSAAEPGGPLAEG
jgi:16S rRNA (uracil1498-N3)-methyltransferase